VQLDIRCALLPSHGPQLPMLGISQSHCLSFYF
jgi:hypothetical protein